MASEEVPFSLANIPTFLKIADWIFQKSGKPPEKVIPSSRQVKDFICYNQAMYAQYNFLASLRHKELKAEMSGPSPSIVKTEYLINSLESHLNCEIENAFLKSLENIKDGFGNRSKYGVRVCIKGQKGNGEIVDLFRDKRMYFGDSYPLSSNTGFKKVNESGGSFLCNNIPKQAKNGAYLNPRLDPQRVGSYELSWNERRKINNGENDLKWISCWDKRSKRDGTSYELGPESCYKSTMIIPMTLIGSSLKPEFSEHFKISMEAEHRGIWGYLCFDNHMENYFYEEIDLHYGYIYADILSLYLITRLTYTKYSEVYKRAKAYVKREEARNEQK